MVAIDAWFNEFDKEFEDKSDDYAAYITHLNAVSKARKEEADRLWGSGGGGRGGDDAETSISG